jgi:hypothetical protein
MADNARRFRPIRLCVIHRGPFLGAEPTEIDGGVGREESIEGVQISAIRRTTPVPKFGTRAVEIDSCVSISASLFFSPVFFLDGQKRKLARRTSSVRLHLSVHEQLSAGDVFNDLE